MSDFKIGDKVKDKYTNKFLGYVSHVHKGKLFYLDTFEILIHLDGVHTTALASELEIYKDE